MRSRRHLPSRGGDASGKRSLKTGPNSSTARSLGSGEPQQPLADPATTKLAANVDGDASPFAVDFYVDEANALVAQEPYPSVPVRRLLNELPPLQARPVEVGIEPALPFLIVCEPAPDQRRKLPRQRRDDNKMAQAIPPTQTAPLRARIGRDDPRGCFGGRLGSGQGLAHSV